MGLIPALLGLACAATPEPAAPAPAPPAAAADTPAVSDAPGARVVAVPMNVSGAIPPSCRLPFGEDGAPCADSSAPVSLDVVQAGVLQGLLADPATWGGDEGKCSLPLHGFAWLRADGTVDKQVAVSLLCDKVEGAPAVPGQPADPATRGLSEDGKLALRALCVQVGLPHCHITQPGEAFGR